MNAPIDLDAAERLNQRAAELAAALEAASDDADALALLCEALQVSAALSDVALALSAAALDLDTLAAGRV